LLTVLVLVLMVKVPYLGGLVAFAIIAGIGAIALSMRRRTAAFP
jgi:hypothetical protein